MGSKYFFLNFCRRSQILISYIAILDRPPLARCRSTFKCHERTFVTPRFAVNLERSRKFVRQQRLVMPSCDPHHFSGSSNIILPIHQIDCPTLEINCCPCLRYEFSVSIPASFKASPIFELVGCASPNRIS